MTRKYWIETYGCQMNVAETDALELELEKSGWEHAQSPEEAHAVLLHTCSVRQTAEDRIWGRLGFYKHLKSQQGKEDRKLRIVVMGCMAERLGERISETYPGVDLVVGNFSKQHIAEELEQLLPAGEGKTRREENDAFEFSRFHSREGAHHAYVPIMHGCDNYCTYCIVPYVRGREISRSPSEIIDEIHRAEEIGVKEISLLGQNVNSYRYRDEDGELRFTGLLRRILDSLGRIEWLRFITSHPKDVPEGLIELMAGDRRLCSHFHLPVQHASDPVLGAMNRRYRRADYLGIIEKLRREIPDISVTTDIMVGFPGETEEDFETLLEMVRQVEFEDAFMYYFNPREGTPAAAYREQVPHELKLERLSRLIALQRSITQDKRGRRIGKVDKVLVDAVSKKNEHEMRGHSERDEPVVFPGSPDLIGCIVPVRLERMSGTTYKGEIVDDPQ
jgi:tRNA-2-methylthio-N6-dimethylallyladenosine synthase